MAKRAMVMGAAALALAIGAIARWPHGASVGGGGGTGSPRGVAIADLDEDGKPETVRLVGAGTDRQMLRLDATLKGASHDVVTVMASQPLSAEVVTPGERWRWVDDTGETKLDVRVFKPDADGPTNMVAITGTQGRRYVWLQSRFLKLDAAQVVPGFSVGLVMLGDPAKALEAMGGAIGKDGRWAEPLTPSVPLMLTMDAGRVEAVSFDSPRLKSANGLRTGETLNEIEGMLPGKREGQTYASPEHGVVATLDARSRVESLKVSRPWRDGSAKK